jgi:hypothetical protein
MFRGIYSYHLDERTIMLIIEILGIKAKDPENYHNAVVSGIVLGT